jgi:hypothetical protein
VLPTSPEARTAVSRLAFDGTWLRIHRGFIADR